MSGSADVTIYRSKTTGEFSIQPRDSDPPSQGGPWERFKNTTFTKGQPYVGLPAKSDEIVDAITAGKSVRTKVTIEITESTGPIKK